MGTSIAGFMTRTDRINAMAGMQRMSRMGLMPWGSPPAFNHLMLFDGTRNDRNNVPLSGNPYQTNIANLYDQANPVVNGKIKTDLSVSYSPGVGSGGHTGGIMAATLWPTPAVNRIADDMYRKAVGHAIRFQNSNPHISPLEYSVSMASFSRGSGSQMNVAWRLENQGLVTPTGQVIAPPGVPVHQMAMLDPVQTGIGGNMCIPPNVKAPILVVESRHERRSQFAVADYGRDPRVVVVRMPGNHAGVGGGQDVGGTGAMVLEGVTRYFQHGGSPIASVPPRWRTRWGAPIALRSDAYQTAHNGDVLYTNGVPATQWRLSGDVENRSRSALSGSNNGLCTAPPSRRPAGATPWLSGFRPRTAAPFAGNPIGQNRSDLSPRFTPRLPSMNLATGHWSMSVNRARSFSLTAPSPMGLSAPIGSSMF